MTKKIMLFALTAITTVMLCGTAMAARTQFADFSLDVPEGWEANEHTDDRGVKSAILTNATKGITLIFGIENLDGKTTQEKAEEFASIVGTEAENAGDGMFLVSFTDANGNDNSVLMIESEDGTQVLGIAITGDANDPEVSAIIGSAE